MKAKPKKKAAPPKGNAIPDKKPINSYEKVAKASIKARKENRKR